MWGSEPRGSAHLLGEAEKACPARLFCEEGLEGRPWLSQRQGLCWAEIPPFLPVASLGPACWSPELQACQFHPPGSGWGWAASLPLMEPGGARIPPLAPSRAGGQPTGPMVGVLRATSGVSPHCPTVTPKWGRPGVRVPAHPPRPLLRAGVQCGSHVGRGGPRSL